MTRWSDAVLIAEVVTRCCCGCRSLKPSGRITRLLPAACGLLGAPASRLGQLWEDGGASSPDLNPDLFFLLIITRGVPARLLRKQNPDPVPHRFFRLF
ncbi:hypothetical protein FQA47_021820 [Oryzias melastigma]|uniref:Uncharacterized protein n=1 Tax=Oryzias melastigma TaxID=30732 RepID=A0A834FRS5_ORYME|nr:hypothetical protein FQA47_021820 [Oryzias melastigma]